MSHSPRRSAATSPFVSLLSRLGHEILWAFIAVLFCVVELAVKVTEFQTLRLFAPRVGARRRQERPISAAIAR